MLRMRAAEGFALHNLGMCLARLDQLDRALHLQREAVDIGTETRHFRLRLNARMCEAAILTWRGEPGDLATARKLIEEVRTEAAQHPVSFVDATAVLGQVALARRDLQEAQHACEEALAGLADVASMQEGEEMLRLTYVETLLALGHPEVADAALLEAHSCVIQRAGQMSKPNHRDAFLSRLYECRRILDLAQQRLGFEHPVVAHHSSPSLVPHHSVPPTPLCSDNES
jgi:tetratricopeptide (TPR) repeat protein